MKVLESKCIGCTKCVDACAVGAITMTGQVAQIDMTRCIKCRMCLAVCPSKAVKM